MAVKAKAEITLSRIVDIESVTRYYLAQPSTASAPAKPTANPPGGNWKTTEPSYTSGATNTLYFVDLTVMTNGTFSYSAVSKASSYEAAKEAFNKAQNAQNTADNISVGGRNLILGTSDEWSDITIGQWNGIVHDRFLCTDVGLAVGDTITFSADIKAVNKTSLTIRIDFYAEATGETGKSAKVGNGSILKDHEGRLFITTVIPEGLEYITLLLQNGDTTADTTSTIEQIKCVKLEKGNKPTDWSPAPEDLATAEGLESSDQAREDLAKDFEERINDVQASVEILRDSLSLMVQDENGASLMEQTETGWVFSMGETLTQLQDAANTLRELSENVDNQGGSIEALEHVVTGLEELSNYVRITTVGDEPAIELGNESSFKVRITNTAIQFMDGTTVPAYVSNQSLKIEKAEVEQELTFGGFSFAERSNGNMGLMWKGGS